LSFGWSGRAKDWQRFEEVSLVLAGLATFSNFSAHTYIFSSLLLLERFSGFAMVNTLLIMKSI
jgi:molybdopterin-containing oxidoreductase family membrane subunit